MADRLQLRRHRAHDRNDDAVLEAIVNGGERVLPEHRIRIQIRINCFYFLVAAQGPPTSDLCTAATPPVCSPMPRAFAPSRCGARRDRDGPETRTESAAREADPR